jgi:hypothetical protein
LIQAKPPRQGNGGTVNAAPEGRRKPRESCRASARIGIIETDSVERVRQVERCEEEANEGPSWTVLVMHASSDIARGTAEVAGLHANGRVDACIAVDPMIAARLG